MKFQRFISVIFFSLFLVLALKAQKGIPAAGGEAKGNRGSASYSVGQLFYTTISSDSGSISQGLQQGYKIKVVSAIENTQGINLSVLAYPNPVTHILILKIDTSTLYKSQSLEYRVYDMKGRLLVNKKIVADETHISMTSLRPSIYFVRVVQKNQALKTFQIIKK